MKQINMSTFDFFKGITFNVFILAALILITAQQISSADLTKECERVMKNKLEPMRNFFPHGSGHACTYKSHETKYYGHSCCYPSGKDKGVKHFKMAVYDCASDSSRLCHRKKYAPQNVLHYKDSTMAQEGRSFCIVGEHYRQSVYYYQSLAFQKLADRFFDIGNHIHPDDSTLMNTNKLFNIHLEFNRTRQKDGYSKVLTTQKLQEDFNQVYCGTRDRPQKLRWGKSYCDKTRDYLTILEEDNSFKNRPPKHSSQMHKACTNPYRVLATRIMADGMQLQNYLHIKVYTDQYNTPGSQCPTGKMKFLMLEVRDHEGFPVGQFTDDVPCNEMPCKKIGQLKCYALQGTKKNILPCMFTHHLASTHPYIFMASANDTGVEYFTEVHITWRFVQSSSHFIKELHFATMIVEDDTPLRYYTSRQTDWEGVSICGLRQTENRVACCTADYNRWGCPRWTCRQYPIGWIGGEFGTPGYCLDHSCSCNGELKPSEPNKYYHCGLTQFCSLNFHASPNNNTDRPYGFSARYTAISLKPSSMGGWDNLRKKYIRFEDLDCHSGIPDNDPYFELMVPPTGAKYSKLIPRKRLFKDEVFRDVVDSHGRPGELTDYMTPGRDVRGNGPYKKNWGYVSDNIEKLMGRVLADVMNDPAVVVTRYVDVVPPRSYLGTHFSKRNSPYQLDPDAVLELKEGIKDMVDDHDARCPCPFIPTTPPPELQTKGPIEKQARHLHAINMLITWVVLVPLGYFVARYYKETFSRVFFLQEFWWFTIHVLALVTGLVFMCGSFYAMHLKRKGTNYQILETDATTLHIWLGYVVFIVYIIHLMLGSFRAWDLKSRIIQMALHWGVGWVQYAVATVVILLAGAIPQGLLNCNAFYTYIAFFIVQLIFYGIMEYRMRIVDITLNLNPPREYFPSPMMRVFHTDAPESIFRMVVLVLYVVICSGFYTALHILTSANESENSCFQATASDQD